MEHQPHITEVSDDTNMGRIIAIVAAVIFVGAVGGYIVFGGLF